MPLYSSLSRWWKLYSSLQFTLVYVWYEGLHFDNGGVEKQEHSGSQSP